MNVIQTCGVISNPLKQCVVGQYRVLLSLFQDRERGRPTLPETDHQAVGGQIVS